MGEGTGRLAIIGAGASGLVTARWSLDAGFEPVLFERAAGPGGLWRPEAGLVYRSLRTNTSKQKTAFSDQPFDDRLPDHPGWTDVLAYLEAYADRFRLRPRIRSGAEVRAVRPAGHGWSVDGEPFEAVVVCTGLFSAPAVPAVPGRETFRGTVLHSRDYREPSPFAGRRVVVVGAGSSAVDIACDVAGVAASVRLAMRDVPMFTPRHFRGRPYDHRATRLARLLPRRLREERARRALDEEYRRHGARLSAFRPKYTPGTDILDHLASGRVVAAPALAALDADGAVFADGSRADADTVILATGFRVVFPFLPDGIPGTVGAALALYRLVFPPEQAGLAFVGMARVSGPVFPVAEIQARWVAAVLAGRATLPPPAAMRAEIETRVARATATGGDPMRVDVLDYLDDVAGRIGARPSLIRHPRLLVSPVSARDYR